MSATRAWTQLLGDAGSAPLRRLADWAQLVRAAAGLLVLTLTPSSHGRSHRGALALHIVQDTAPLLAGYTALCALLTVVVARIVVTTALSYGLSQYALELVVRVLVIELIPLSAALLVALRCTIPSGADVARLRRRGALQALRAQGIDPLQREVVPRVVAGLFATLLLAALSSVVAMVLVYLTVYGFTLAGLAGYTRTFGQVFNPGVALVFGLKTLFFSLGVSLMPLASALYDGAPERSRTRAELRGLVRMLVVLLMIEMASLVGNYY